MQVEEILAVGSGGGVWDKLENPLVSPSEKETTASTRISLCVDRDTFKESLLCHVKRERETLGLRSAFEL